VAIGYCASERVYNSATVDFYATLLMTLNNLLRSFRLLEPIFCCYLKDTAYVAYELITVMSEWLFSATNCHACLHGPADL